MFSRSFALTAAVGFVAAVVTVGHAIAALVGHDRLPVVARVPVCEGQTKPLSKIVNRQHSSQQKTSSIQSRAKQTGRQILI